MPSSAIRDFDYDMDARQLIVLFTTGRRYLYSAVPADVADGLASASSKGRYFNARIRDAYDFVELASVG